MSKAGDDSRLKINLVKLSVFVCVPHFMPHYGDENTSMLKMSIDTHSSHVSEVPNFLTLLTTDLCN